MKTCFPSARRAGLLHAVEFHKRLPVVEQRAKFGILRVAQIALGLHHLIVRRHADFEPARFGVEPLLRQLPGGSRGREPLDVVLHRERRVGHIAGHAQLRRRESAPGSA